MRRFVPVVVHGVVDYLTGPALVAAPELFRMKEKSAPAAIAPRVLGAQISAMNALTDQPLAVKRLIPMKAHLAVDAVGGIALAALPWITRDAKRGARYWLPHALVGGKELFLAAFTHTKTPSESARRARG